MRFGDRSTGGGTFGRQFGACHGIRGTAVLDGGQRRPRGRGGFGGFLFSIFTVGNSIGSPTVKCFGFVCENFTTFPFGKRIVGKLDSWAFWRCIQFQEMRMRNFMKN